MLRAVIGEHLKWLNEVRPEAKISSIFSVTVTLQIASAECLSSRKWLRYHFLMVPSASEFKHLKNIGTAGWNQTSLEGERQ